MSYLIIREAFAVFICEFTITLMCKTDVEFVYKSSVVLFDFGYSVVFVCEILCCVFM